MAPAERTILVTGAGRYLGTRLVERLCHEPSVARVIAVDTVPPRSPLPERAEFVRADIRHPLIGKVLDQAAVHTVVHAGMVQPRTQPWRTGPRDEHVEGAASLLVACERSRTVSRVIAGSTTHVYGAGPGSPAVFAEDMGPVGDLHGAARDAAEIEGFLRSLGRARPDIDVDVLRLADLVGTGVDTWLTHYLALPVIPTMLCADARLQVLHEIDAVEALTRAASGPSCGVVNVAGDGVVMLSQVLHWAHRTGVPLPAPALGVVLDLTRPPRLTGVDPAFLGYGRVVDTTRIETRLSFTPRFTTAEALRSFLGAQSGAGGVRAVALGSVQRVLSGLAGVAGALT